MRVHLHKDFFSVNTVNVFSFPYDFLNIILSLAYFKNTVYNTYKVQKKKKREEMVYLAGIYASEMFSQITSEASGLIINKKITRASQFYITYLYFCSLWKSCLPMLSMKLFTSIP